MLRLQYKISIMKCYIKYLNAEKNYKEEKKDFKTREEAISFMKNTFDKIDSDLIHYY